MIMACKGEKKKKAKPESDMIPAFVISSFSSINMGMAQSCSRGSSDWTLGKNVYHEGGQILEWAS